MGGEGRRGPDLRTAGSLANHAFASLRLARSLRLIFFISRPFRCVTSTLPALVPPALKDSSCLRAPPLRPTDLWGSPSRRRAPPGPQPHLACAYGRAAAAERAGGGGGIREKRRGRALGAGPVEDGAGRGAGGRNCLPPREDEAAAAGVAGGPSPATRQEGTAGSCAPCSVNSGAARRAVGRDTRGSRATRRRPRACASGPRRLFVRGSRSCHRPRALRAGPHRAGERAGSPPPFGARRTGPLRAPAPLSRDPGTPGGGGLGWGRRGRKSLFSNFARRREPTTWRARSGRAPADRHFREGLRSWAGVTRRRWLCGGAATRGPRAPPSPGARPAAEFGGSERGEKERPFVCRGRCAARLRAQAGSRKLGGHICSALRGRAAGAPQASRAPGPRRAARTAAAGVGWGLVFPGPLPPPPRGRRGLPLSQSGFEPPKSS